MGNYLRNYVPGGTFFFTVVTEQRRRFLTSPLARRCLRQAVRIEKAKRPFDLFAIVLLPDHLHAVWVLPEADADFSVRWRKIKEGFTRAYLAAGGREGRPRPWRIRHGQRAIWQPRFWEHTCRNEADLKRCVDYLHWNPVKHGLASRVIDYPWSSFHRFVGLGEYPEDWGGVNPFEGFDLPE